MRVTVPQISSNVEVKFEEVVLLFFNMRFLVKVAKTKIASLKILIIFPAFTLVGTISGCASNLTGYYSKLRTKIDSGDYESAAKFVDKSLP